MSHPFRGESYPPRPRPAELPAETARTTFAVHDVAAPDRPLAETHPKRAVQRLVGGKAVEACSDYRGTLVACRFHPLVEATWAAYDDHRPLVLSPDIIWLTIAQGLALHVNEHAEQLRHHFVSHSGTEALAVRRDDFVPGSPENPWGEVIGEFSRQIAGRIGPMHRLIVADFSTTGPVERTASEVVLMDTVKNYFSFDLWTRCGIPAVTLEGTVGDWEAIFDRLAGLEALGLSWWTDAVGTIIAQFVAAASGDADVTFWRSIFKAYDASGGPSLTGWLLHLFPYVPCGVPGGRPHRRNPSIPRGPGETPPEPGLRTEDLPSPLSSVPFRWTCRGRQFDYEFFTGLIGIEQDRETWALRPKIGWAVRDRASRGRGRPSPGRVPGS